MNTAYRLDAYRSHDLNIAMKTSSGDTITLDFSNSQALSMSASTTEKGSQSSLSFASQQSFKFAVDSNGINAQDKKEIDAFMKIAQPYIDNFLSQLQEDAPTSPVNKVARDVASAFSSLKGSDTNRENLAKNSIVSLFDDSMKKLSLPKEEDTQTLQEKILQEAQKLLEKTLQAFDELGQKLYA